MSNAAGGLQMSKTLEQLEFDNQTLRALPIDNDERKSARQVRGACFSKVQPSRLDSPELVCAAISALSLLDIRPDEVQRPDFAEYFCGNKLLRGTEPAAHCYCGYQFGYFSGQLGDGAAMYLGEVVNQRGERWELQLKGAGLTPYSRQADGRKVLRSSIREFLCSEAMHHLGIPTTRAATLVTSRTRVTRDVHYTGNPIEERCSVVSRIAPTFLRFGSYEIFKPVDPLTGRQGPSAGLERQLLPRMLDFTIRAYFPDIWAAHGGGGGGGGDEISGGAGTSGGGDEQTVAQKQDMYLAFYKEVVRRTAALAAQWQCVGFCHGVLNTDNMSIVGVTLDYGPYGFLDRYDPDHVCNGSDDSGRYDYKSQPEICRWNCQMLAEAMAVDKAAPLLQPAVARRALSTFDLEYDRVYWGTMRKKLGLLQPAAAADETDQQLVQDVLKVMHDTGADFTNTFRTLSRFPMPSADANAGGSSGTGNGHSTSSAATAGPATASTSAGLSFPDGGVLEQILSNLADAATMAKASKPRMPEENLNMLLMLAARDPGMLHALGTDLKTLLREKERVKVAERWRGTSEAAKQALDRARWSAWLQRYALRLQQEAAAGGSTAERVRVMNATNPRYVLRNWIAQLAIEKAEKGDYSEVERVLRTLERPYDDEDSAADLTMPGGGEASIPPYDRCPPKWASDLCVTCSS